MTEQDNFYQKYRGFIATFYALSIAVTSGFGIQYLLISTGDTVLYSQFAALTLGSGLAIVYTLSESKNFKYRERLEEVE